VNPATPRPSAASAAKSPIWRRALERAGARASAIALLLLFLAASFAPFVAPCDPLRPDDAESHLPPNVGFVDSSGRVHAWPVVRSLHRENGAARPIARIGRDASLALFVRGDPWELGIPGVASLRCDLHLFGVRGDGPRAHLLGTDLRGRDLFARVVRGAWVSLSIAVLGVLVSFSIGMVLGGLAGWFGGRVDLVLMRLCELLLLLPGFYVLLALRGAVGEMAGWSSARVHATIVVIVSAIWWAGLARAIRGQVLSIRTREHVQAARALGASAIRILLQHLLPGTLPFALVAAALAIPGYVVMESGLSMLGLGIQEPEPSWGNLLAEATRVSQVSEHPWMLAPGVFLCVAVAAFNVLADALRAATGDPRAA
jgi:peptide/nickel transport system permease protein